MNPKPFSVTSRLIVPFIDVPSLSLRFLTLFELRDSRDGSFPELRGLIGNLSLAGSFWLRPAAVERRDEFVETGDSQHLRMLLGSGPNPVCFV